MGTECVDNCRLLDLNCNSNCEQDDYACQNQCAGVLARCIQQCPCQEECRLGCDDCESPFCQCQADGSAEKIECENDANQDYFDCIIGCGGDNSCMSECTRIYNEQLSHCPCYADCPNGCPCPNYAPSKLQRQQRPPRQ